MDLQRQIIDAVNRYWAEHVQILGTWSDGPAAVCVVYRRSIDPATIIGARFEFDTGAADGTVEGFARDIAINLAEPIGTLSAASRQDKNGIVWVAISHDHPTPEPPLEVIARL